MRIERIQRIVLCLLMLCLPLAGFAESVRHQVVPLDQRIRLLQSGGLVLVMRHAATEHDQRDLDRSVQPDCSRQRNLSDLGRAQMDRMRQSLAQLGMVIGEVFASPYCRTRQTAEEAFGKFTVDPDLEFSISKGSAEARRLSDHLLRRVRSIDPGSGNAVFVTHSANIRDAIGVWPDREGAVLLIEQAPRTLIYRGTIDPEQWPSR